MSRQGVGGGCGADRPSFPGGAALVGRDVFGRVCEAVSGGPSQGCVGRLVLTALVNPKSVGVRSEGSLVIKAFYSVDFNSQVPREL